MVRLAMTIFCRKIIINNPAFLKKKGPLLLASNHPNSFLDAVILLTLFEQPVFSLTRGDVFKKTFYRKLLTSLKMLPVFRTTEGAENLNVNYETFTACKDIFKKNGIVLIFSEGKCVNEWHLRQLKKGTARLAFKAWDENIALEVLPIGINYSSFRRFGKNIFINFGEVISKNDLDMSEPEGKRYQAFNQSLEKQLQDLVFEIEKVDHVTQKEKLEKKPALAERIALFIPAFIGWLVHVLLYWPLRIFTHNKTKHNDHYDSILMALLLFSYPIYLLIIVLLLFLLTRQPFVFLLFLFLPFTAWAYTRLKQQLDKI